MPTNHPGPAGLVANVRRHAAYLEEPVSLWVNRADSPTAVKAHERRAVTEAVHTIDLMLADLHHLRSGMIASSRSSDDAFMAALARRYGVA